MEIIDIKNRYQIHRLFEKSNLIGAEIGVETGTFTNYLLRTNFFTKFYAIDSWNTEFFDVLDDANNPLYIGEHNHFYLDTIKKLEKFDNVKIIREKSEYAVHFFDNGYFDFIYIDSDHRYENVKKDLNMWWPKLKNGGILCGDDYFDGVSHIQYKSKKYRALFGVKRAVNEFCKENNKTKSLIPRLSKNKKNEYPNWIIVK